MGKNCNPNHNYTCNFNSELKDNRKNTHLNLGILSFQYFFDIKHIYAKSVIVFFLAVFMGFFNFFLIERTGIYTPGINALHQSLARVVNLLIRNSVSEDIRTWIYFSLFWNLNILFNLIFAIFCYKKIGKCFTWLSILYITVLSLTGLTLSAFPDSYGFKDFYLFSNPFNENSKLTDVQIKFLGWPLTTGKVDDVKYGYKILIIFFYGFIYGIVNTFVSLIIYSLGSAMGGLDWIIFYLYKTKSYSCNKLLFNLGLLVSFFAYFIGTYLPYVVFSGEREAKILIPNLLSPMFFSTMIMIFSKKILFNIFYPQFKFVNVKVFTNKYLELRNLLMEKNFLHSFTITHSIGSYQLRKQTQLEFICYSIELSELIKNIHIVEPNCLIVATSIKSLNGNMTINNTF